MISLPRYAWRSLIRNPGRSLTYLLGLILAVGLLADTLFFVDLSQRDMTQNALAPVKMDMVARATTPDLSPTQLESTLKNQPLVKAALPVTSSDFSSLTKVGSTTSTSAGKVFALPLEYYQTFNFLPIVTGKFEANAALIGDATATQMALKVGDTVQVNFARGLNPYRIKISGIVAMGSSEPLFYNPDPAGGEGYGVVADVLFLPPALFERDLAPSLAKLPTTSSSVGQTGSSIVLLPLERQVHLRLERSNLNSDPAKAAKELDSLRRSLERPFPGRVRVQDNMSKKLFNAKKDILAAKMLLIFLSLPGILLAAYLARYASELASSSLARELGLLRVRGASSRQILQITLFTSLWVGVAGSVLGLLFGAAILVAVQGTGIFSVQNLDLIWPSVGWSLLAGLVLTLLAFFLPAWSQLRSESAPLRKTVSRKTVAPLWQRMFLDLLFLITASVVLYITDSSGGFKPIRTEGTAVTLSFYLFLAPFLYWIGITLLLVRLLGILLSRGGPWVRRILTVLIGEMGTVVAQSLQRRRAVVGSAVTLTALALGFGVALTLFLGTYTVQKQGDIHYVVGSDIRITPPASAGLTPDFAHQLERISGVAHVTSLSRDAVALIGSEKKSVYGIDVKSFSQTAYLPDAMFENGSAQKTLQALESTPNGVLLARDQADKFDIKVGDPVLMRLYNPKTAQYTQLEGKAVGIFTYLPTSSQDSDFVLNRSFMTAQTGTVGADLFLVKTTMPNTPTALEGVARAIQSTFGQTLTLKLETTQTAIKVDESSLTSLNLASLGTLERIYTALIVAAGLGLFLMSMLESRRREFGTLRALGTDDSQMRRLLSAETLSISSLSVLAGLVIGTIMASLFIMLLRVIFLIPPAGLSWPWLELGGLFLLALLGLTVGLGLASNKLKTLRVSEVLREI